MSLSRRIIFCFFLNRARDTQYNLISDCWIKNAGNIEWVVYVPLLICIFVSIYLLNSYHPSKLWYICICMYIYIYMHIYLWFPFLVLHITINFFPRFSFQPFHSNKRYHFDVYSVITSFLNPFLVHFFNFFYIFLFFFIHFISLSFFFFWRLA